MPYTRIFQYALVFGYTAGTLAQINFPDIPTSVCVGPSGTATFSSDMTIETGSQRIPAGTLWNQEGATWVFSTDTEGIKFSNLGIPGGGRQDSIPQINENALQIDDSGTAWTLAVPTVTDVRQFDIVFQASPTPTPPVKRGINDLHHVAVPPEAQPASRTQQYRQKKHVPVGTKFRRQNKGSFHLIIEGRSFRWSTDPCHVACHKSTLTGQREC